MESFTANTQIPRHSLIRQLIRFFCISIIFFSFQAFAQNDSTPNKRALKYFEKAEAYIKDRDFNEGISHYKKAIEKDPGFAKAYQRLAMSYDLLREMDSAFRYYDLYRQQVGINNLSEKSALFILELYLKNGNYELAKRLFPEMSVVDTSNETYQELKQKLDFISEGIQHPFEAQIVLLSDSVNRFYSQYFPTITVDNSQLIFTRRNGNTYYDDEDLVISYFRGGQWSAAESISQKINSQYNEGAATISADGRTLIYTSCEEQNTLGSCDLFISFKSGDQWSKPRNLGPTVNSRYWDSQPSLSADGRLLYFSSNRPGGKGGRDLWLATYENDQWTSPINAGAAVNTQKDEVTPYLHFNNQTLFFSSNGHVGYGGYDLFRSEIADTLPGKPVNLGFGINNHLDQVSMTITAYGNIGLFSQELLDEQSNKVSKLTQVDLSQAQLVENKAVFVTGRVTDIQTGAPVKDTITLNDLNSEKLTYETQADGLTGSFYFVLTQGSTYGVFVKAKNYLFEDFTFDVTSTDASRPDSLFINLQPLKVDAKLTLENIYFEFDSYDLSSKSRSELKDIAKFLKANDIKVEISGHTDAKGGKEYNLDLSEKRAENVYNYLIKLGVSDSKMEYKGYGDTKPVFESDLENPKNRRIDFKILKVNQDL